MKFFVFIIFLDVMLCGNVEWRFEVMIILNEEDVVFCFFMKNLSLFDILILDIFGWMNDRICLKVVFVICVVFFNILIFELVFIKCNFFISLEVGINLVLIVFLCIE